MSFVKFYPHREPILGENGLKLLFSLLYDPILYIYCVEIISRCVPVHSILGESHFFLWCHPPPFPCQRVLTPLLSPITHPSMWKRSASFVLDNRPQQSGAPGEQTLAAAVSGYYKTRAEHHVVVSEDWLEQAEVASIGGTAGGGRRGGGGAVDVIEEFNFWRKKPDLAEAVAAIMALSAVIRSSEATTMMQLEIDLKKASDALKVGNDPKITLFFSEIGPLLIGFVLSLVSRMRRPVVGCDVDLAVGGVRSVHAVRDPNQGHRVRGLRDGEVPSRRARRQIWGTLPQGRYSFFPSSIQTPKLEYSTLTRESISLRRDASSGCWRRTSSLRGAQSWCTASPGSCSKPSAPPPPTARSSASSAQVWLPQTYI